MKRLSDLLIGASALIVLSPFLIIISILVAVRLGRPVFFVQPRPGLHGGIFNFLKFRSMTSECDSEGNLLPDEQRMTPFGTLLRKTSLDELPALINVVRGHMSLVGPRPLLVRYLPRYSTRQARRHEVKPGITGWAQINGRNAISWEEKFELDVWYVENHSIWLDLKILLLTIPLTLFAKDINASSHVTMPEFTGSTQVQND